MDAFQSPSHEASLYGASPEVLEHFGQRRHPVPEPVPANAPVQRRRVSAVRWNRLLGSLPRVSATLWLAARHQGAVSAKW